MDKWQELIRDAITTPEKAGELLAVNAEELKEPIKKFPMRINSYYLGLIKKKGDSIWKQSVPDQEELNTSGMVDPLAEDEDMPVPGLTHRYPDRVLFYVTNVCAMYCRFCTRNRKVGNPASAVSSTQIQQGIEYIRSHPEVRDVILSGGDPLMLPDTRLEWIISQLRTIPHLELIRIGSRMPVTLPHRITPELVSMLKKYRPIHVNTHFNNTQEVTPEARQVCKLLLSAGITIGNQTVMLKGVNDKPHVMKQLMLDLISIGVKPYYVYQCDTTVGVEHFRTQISDSLKAMSGVKNFIGYLSTPYYVIDAPGGGGKIPIITKQVGKLGLEFMEVSSQEEVESVKANPKVRSVRITKDIDDPEFEQTVSMLRDFSKELIITVNSHAIVNNPTVITEEKADFFASMQPFWLNTAFSNAEQIEKTKPVLDMLEEKGVPLGNVTFLNGNETVQTMRKLVHELLKVGIKPYYIVANGENQQEKVKVGYRIIKSLRGFTSGLAVPHLMLDEGVKKTLLCPNYVVSHDDDKIVLNNYAGELYVYPEPVQDEGCFKPATKSLISESAEAKTGINVQLKI